MFVFNNICVILVCFYGWKLSGGKVEVLVECVLDEYCCLVYVCVFKVFKEGMVLVFGEDKLGEGNGLMVIMIECYDIFFEL